jgi:hypothetical protein
MLGCGSRVGLCAVLLAALATGTAAFSPMLQAPIRSVGSSSFVAKSAVSAPVPARCAVRPSVLRIHAAYPPLRNANIIGKPIPGNWKQGVDFDFNPQVLCVYLAPFPNPCSCTARIDATLPLCAAAPLQSESLQQPRRGSTTHRTCARFAPAALPRRVPCSEKPGAHTCVCWTQLAVGDTVFVTRSDGTRRFGEVVGSAGLPWQNSWEICVEAERGQVASTRAEAAATIGKQRTGTRVSGSQQCVPQPPTSMPALPRRQCFRRGTAFPHRPCVSCASGPRPANRLLIQQKRAPPPPAGRQAAAPIPAGTQMFRPGTRQVSSPPAPKPHPRPSPGAAARAPPGLESTPGRVLTRTPPPSLCTKWTRRVPHPVPIGHAASLTPY